MVSIHITEVKKIDLADNTRQIEVAFDILDEEGELIDARKLGFEFGLTIADIKNELIKYAKTFNKEIEDRVANAAKEAEEKKADEAIADLPDLEVSSEDELEEKADEDV